MHKVVKDAFSVTPFLCRKGLRSNSVWRLGKSTIALILLSGDTLLKGKATTGLAPVVRMINHPPPAKSKFLAIT